MNRRTKIGILLLITLTSLQTYQTYVGHQQLVVLQDQPATKIMSPEPTYLSYDHLGNGWYTIVTIVNPHDGTAILRQSLPTADRLVVVSNLPTGMLVTDSHHRVLRLPEY